MLDADATSIGRMGMPGRICEPNRLHYGPILADTKMRARFVIGTLPHEADILRTGVTIRAMIDDDGRILSCWSPLLIVCWMRWHPERKWIIGLSTHGVLTLARAAASAAALLAASDPGSARIVALKAARSAST